MPQHDDKQCCSLPAHVDGPAKRLHACKAVIVPSPHSPTNEASEDGMNQDPSDTNAKSSSSDEKELGNTFFLLLVCVGVYGKLTEAL